MSVLFRGCSPLLNQILSRTYYGTSRIGQRDIVGHGCNGMNAYKDDPHFPFPAIRFQENTPYLTALRQKEKGDWRQLSKTEKKELYRASFCQTFSEFQYFTGSWMFCLGWALIFISGGFWGMMFHWFFVANKERPHTFEPEEQRRRLRRMIDLRVNPIDGISSLWNYDDDDWLWSSPVKLEETVDKMAPPAAEELRQLAIVEEDYEEYLEKEKDFVQRN